MPARSTRTSSSKTTASKAPPKSAVKKEHKGPAQPQDAASSSKPGSKSSKSARTSARQQQQQEPTMPVKPSPNTARKRKAADVKREDAPGDENVKKEEENEDTPIKTEDEPPAKRRATKASPSRAKKTSSKKAAVPDLAAGAEMAAKFVAAKDAQAGEDSSTKSARTKNNPYGLSPGESPFPSYPHPTPEECHEVNCILEGVHGKVSKPVTIPTPSLNSSGCGEVPSILDALVRTRLSAATNNANSSRAFRGLVEKFGLLKEGVGKGSVNWNKVRLAPVKEVFKAIQSGGLADVKSRDIQKILNMVHEENQARKAELPETGENGDPTDIAKAKEDVLSLDHIHNMGNDEAFAKLLEYPGIGPKTASCVLLFCMQRPSFAVDTHVFRLTKWLGWVPTDQQARAMLKRGEAKSAQVTRNSCYAHCEVRVPDDLKYPLHYLLIRHGKECGWCSAKAGQAARVGVCPLAGLMKGKGRSKGSAKKTKKEEGEDEDDVKEEDGAADEDVEDDEVEVKGDDSAAEKMHGLQT